MDTFAEQVKTWIQRAGQTRREQAKACRMSTGSLQKILSDGRGVSDKMLRNICQGIGANDIETVRLEQLLALRRTKGTSLKYLMPYNTEIGPISRVAQKVPLYQIGAGRELAFDDGGNPLGVANNYLTVPGLTDPNAFGCTVRGDSMAPELVEGDVVVFSPALERQSGKIHLVTIADDSTIKRVYFEKTYLRLVASNPQYPERRIPRAEVVQFWRLYSVTKIVGREE